jgi:hypothetical protein
LVTESCFADPEASSTRAYEAGRRAAPLTFHLVRQKAADHRVTARKLALIVGHGESC